MTFVDAQSRERVLWAFRRLDSYMQRESYRGFDPYDALSSPLFKLPLLKSSKILRLAAQQVVRRLPFNVRPILAIPKGLNPVTIGLVIQAYTYMAEVLPDQRDVYVERVDHLLQQLKALLSQGYSGDCWGYDFDWEARYGRVPAYTPTVVATGIITNGLFECHRILRNESALQMCKSAVDFVRKDLNRTVEGEGFCFSYSPLDHQVVLNATLKGARLLAQVYSVTNEPALADEARRTVAFVVRHQRSDGSWPYAIGDTRTWVDNFHTGYVLDCLNEYSLRTGNTDFNEAYRKAYHFYRETFVSKCGIPNYYSDRIHPIDATAIAQTILTLTRNGDRQLATKVAEWTIQNLQDPKGYMYYQKHKIYINTIPYMRWSNAWMLVAFAYLLEQPSA